MINLGISSNMALEQKYEKIFRNECDILFAKIIHGLQKLASNQQNVLEIKKIVQSADTIIGNARFLEDKKIEQIAMTIVKSFGYVLDIEKGINEYCDSRDRFDRPVNKGVEDVRYRNKSKFLFY